MDCYIALGSNLGDRAKNLDFALRALEQGGLAPRAVSSVWETEPVDAREQSWFWNMAVRVEADHSPLELLDLLQSIESRAGRVRTVPNAPRTLDLDILMIDDLVVEEPRLNLPHPRMWGRRFVLEPLAEIAPAVRNPRNGRTVSEERARLSDEHAARKIGRLASRRSDPI